MTPAKLGLRISYSVLNLMVLLALGSHRESKQDREREWRQRASGRDKRFVDGAEITCATTNRCHPL